MSTITELPVHDITSAHVDRDALYRKVRWRLMPMLVLCYVCAFINRSNVGFAKLEFVKDLGFDEVIYGFGAGIFYAGYMVFEVPSNLYLAKRGARRTLLRIMVLWGLASAGMALMQSPTQFYTLRVILGAAEAGLFPGVLLYLTFWVPASRRARFTSVFMVSIALSGLIGGPLSSAIMGGMNGVLGLAGWQWLFIIEGLPSCLLGVIAYWYLSDGPASAPWLDERERHALVDDLARDHTGATGPVHRSFGPVLRDPRFYVLVCMAYALFASIGAVSFWLPSIIRESGIRSTGTIGLLSAIPYLTGAVAQILVGRHSDKHLERRWHTAVPALIAATSWGLLPFLGGRPVPALIILCLATAGTLASMVPFWTIPPTLLTGTAVAAGIALISTVGSFANLVSPILVGWLARNTGLLAAGQYYYAVVTALGALALAIGGRRRAPVPTPAPATSEV